LYTFKKREIVVQGKIVWLLLGVCITCFVAPSAWAKNGETEYAYWNEKGVQAAFQAVRMLREQYPQFNNDNSLVLTNAGYAEVQGQSTMGALDGVSSVLKVSRGKHNLVEIHSAPSAALWFAVYDKASGLCAYLQVDPNAVQLEKMGRGVQTSLFDTAVVEQINAEHIFENAALYAQKFDNKIFKGNEFRIVTITNALAVGVSTRTARTFEFHDHYCPGVTSGILMANYIDKFIPGGRYFIQGVQPWCKEDALLVILNTTPGKKNYAVSYANEQDIAGWPDWAKNASTIVYSYNGATEIWSGYVLAYTWGDAGCPDYKHGTIDRLCTDLWYLDKMDQPENFVSVVRQFALPPDVSPQDYARPGRDPILLIDTL
jgi:formylmethanofuran dehydrogenase subunit E-like metal-binding protein